MQQYLYKSCPVGSVKMIEYRVTTAGSLVCMSEAVYQLISESLQHTNQRLKVYEPEDLASILRLHRPDKVKTASELPEDTHTVMAYSHDALAGIGFLANGKHEELNHKDYAFLAGLYARPDYGKFLVGPKIFGMLLGYAKEHGVKTVQAFPFFPKRVRQYAKLGFRATGRMIPDKHTGLKYPEMELQLQS